MGRVFQIVALMVACSFAGCSGASFVGFVSNPGGTGQVTGTITAVVLGSVESGAGGLQTITTVTFSNGVFATNISFCGDQRNVFPLNRVAMVNYNPGVSCSMLVSIAFVNQSDRREG